MDGNIREADAEKVSTSVLESALPAADAGNKPAPHQLQRQLQNRHVAMISIGGAIGTGLFIGTGTALSNGGPFSLVVGYCLMALMVWALMCSLGEMIAHLPIAGGHLALADRFFSPSLSFTLGWSYWYLWSIVLPTELSASALFISFWTVKVHLGIWIFIFLAIVALINLGGVRFYGEMEFWFSSLKIITIVGVLILGFVLDLGAVTGDTIGFRYWKNPGLFVQYEGVPGAAGRFLGFFSVLVTAAFSFIGVEMPAIAAAEAKNPRRNLPRAIKRVAARVVGFYILSTIVVSMLVPSNEPRLRLSSSTGAKSPFVIAIHNAGIKGMSSVINGCLLSFTLSAASSDLYISSRSLYGLSITGNAPRFLSKTTSNGLPIYCYLIGVMMGTLAFMATGDGQAGKLFGYLANLTSVTGLLSWSGIFITYIRFRGGMKLQNFDRQQLPYRSPVGVTGAWFGLVSCNIIIIFNGFSVFLKGKWNSATFFTCYFPVAAFVFLFCAHAWWTKAGLVQKKHMDFATGSDCPDEDEESPPKSWVQKVWRAIM
uniref:Amino acid transporter n=1 Tax=Uromyces fabae TaxID=55588 RepID=Q700T6_UROFA|nr:amino acid transporter [Uromyces viciae-fabae]